MFFEEHWEVDRNKIRKIQQDQVADTKLGHGLQHEIREGPAAEPLAGAELEHFTPIPLG